MSERNPEVYRKTRLRGGRVLFPSLGDQLDMVSLVFLPTEASGIPYSRMYNVNVSFTAVPPKSYTIDRLFNQTGKARARKTTKQVGRGRG